jgi:endonuclease-3
MPAAKKVVAPTSSADAQALAKKVETIIARLEEHYADNLRSALNSRNAFEKLVATILAAQCTDARVNTVTPALFAEFPDARALAQADIERVKTLISKITFPNNKAKALVGAAKLLVERHGGEVPGDMDALCSLPGAGRKTAWCVLDEYFDRQGIIVDTHLKRVGARLGLHTLEDPVKIEFALGEIVPENRRRSFTHGLTHHGRAFCDARKPKCAACFLNDLCPSRMEG